MTTKSQWIKAIDETANRCANPGEDDGDCAFCDLVPGKCRPCIIPRIFGRGRIGLPCDRQCYMSIHEQLVALALMRAIVEAEDPVAIAINESLT